MKFNYLKAFFVAGVFATSLASCSVETDTTELSTEVQTFTFEDIFEGPNSATVELDLTAAMESNDALNGKEVENASLASITLMKDDSLGFSQITSAKLQIMGEGEETPMIDVAFNDKIEGTSKEITLEILDEVELEEYVKEGKMYLILDGNFSEDSDEYIDVKAKVNFNIETAKK